MQDPECLAYLRKFSVRALAVESLEFMLDVQAYQKAVDRALGRNQPSDEKAPSDASEQGDSGVVLTPAPAPRSPFSRRSKAAMADKNQQVEVSIPSAPPTIEDIEGCVDVLLCACSRVSLAELLLARDAYGSAAPL